MQIAQLFKLPALINKLDFHASEETLWSLFFLYIKKHWAVYLLGILAMSLTNACQMMIPRLTGWMIQLFQTQELPLYLQVSDLKSGYFKLCLMTFFVLIFMALSRVLWRVAFVWPTIDVQAALRSHLWDKARFLSRYTHHRHLSLGQMMSLSTSDTKEASFVFGFTLAGVFDTLFLTLFAFYGLFSIDWHFAIAMMALYPLTPLIIRRLSRSELKRYTNSQDQLAKLNEEASECVNSIKLQKLTNSFDLWLDKLIQSSRSYKNLRLKAVLTSLGYIPIMGSLTLISYVLLFFLGIYKVMNQTLSVGDFVTIQGFIFLLKDPMADVGYIISEWQRAKASMLRIFKMMKLESDPSLLHQSHSSFNYSELVDRDVSLLYDVKELNFSYPSQEKNVFSKPLSFQMRPGVKIGISGAVGTGKTTLLSLLAGIESNYEGDIFFQGKNIKSIDYKKLTHKIAFVSQTPFLFADSIYQNILLNDEDNPRNRERVFEVLKASEFLKDLESLPDSIDTQLGEWGVNLSGGQRQRLTLARALYRGAEVFLFDDCLSAIDRVTEKKILTNLTQMYPHASIVWATHRESTFKLFDEVIYLDGSFTQSENMDGPKQ